MPSEETIAQIRTAIALLDSIEMTAMTAVDWSQYNTAASRISQMSPSNFCELISTTYDLYRKLGIGYEASHILTSAGRATGNSKGKIKDVISQLKENISLMQNADAQAQEAVRNLDPRLYESHVPTPVPSLTGGARLAVLVHGMAGFQSFVSMSLKRARYDTQLMALYDLEVTSAEKQIIEKQTKGKQGRDDLKKDSAQEEQGKLKSKNAPAAEESGRKLQTPLRCFNKSRTLN